MSRVAGRRRTELATQPSVAIRHPNKCNARTGSGVHDVIRRVKRVIVGTVNDVDLNHILAFAAALSYYFVMAFFPALIALAAVVAYLPIPNLFNTIISTWRGSSRREHGPDPPGLLPT